MKLNIRYLLGAAGVIALGVVIVLGVRYARNAVAPDVAGPAGEPVTLQFVKNAAVLPETTLQDIDGKTISTADWKGKVVLVNFWATWCPPCREEIPDFVRMQEHYGDQLLIVGISADEGELDEVREFAREHKMNYPIVMQTPEILELFPGVFALPTTFVLDRDTRPVQKHVGLVSPAIYELETRVLSGLPANARVEEVQDQGQVLLSNAAQATEIPGVDLSVLTSAQRTVALTRLNEEECSCGCHLTVAQCRINDPTCTTSPKIAQQIVDEERAK